MKRIEFRQALDSFGLTTLSSTFCALVAWKMMGALVKLSFVAIVRVARIK